MTTIDTLQAKVQARFSPLLERIQVECGELTIEVAAQHLLEVCLALRDEPDFDFKLLVDVCGVDYLHYGMTEWETESATETGFERGREVRDASFLLQNKPKERFATVYHLLSINLNHRVRIRVFLNETQLTVPSVTALWPAANWFEREAYDLFGIVFTDHPDLRRILTDYGFIGHPFRKDFPLIGNVEARYDAQLRRVF
jgi:NADH-quinone oxidoreductase subunit C